MILKDLIQTIDEILININKKKESLKSIPNFLKIEIAGNKMWLSSEKTIDIDLFNNHRFNIFMSTLIEILKIISQLKKHKDLINKDVTFNTNTEKSYNKFYRDERYNTNLFFKVGKLNYIFYLQSIKV